MNPLAGLLLVAVTLVQPGGAAGAPGHRPSTPRTPADVTSDFNGDGYEDLAVGVFAESVGSVEGAGAVNVIYGSGAGLTSVGNQLWTQDSPDILDQAEPLDTFGRSLAAGDLNGDGYDDLAIGSPHEDVPGVGGDAGAVNVLYGSSAGLTATGNQFWTEDDLSASDGAEAGDLFARALDIADFDGDGYGDVAVGIGYEIVNDQPDAGAAAVIYGSAAGLTDVGNQWWNQDSPGILDECEPMERFGWSLTGNDFDGDGYDDLAIGNPGENPGGVSGAGGVAVIYGSPVGLTSDGNQLWTEDLLSSSDGPEEGDYMGRSVRSADFDADGYADLVAGIPSEDVGDIEGAGAVSIIYGSAAGLTDAGNQSWNQDSPGIKDQAERMDRFGRHEGVGDFNGDGYFDLGVGVVSEDIGTVGDGGAVNVIYGSAAGLTATGNQFWNQDSKRVLGRAEDFDAFGRAVAGIDFNGDGIDDLAVGVPGDVVSGMVAAGSVNVLYGTTSGLRARGNQLWNQDSPDILDQAESGDVLGGGLPGQPAGGCGRGGTCTD